MAAEERDRTEDWLLPTARRTPTIAELEARIDSAIGIARAAEGAALEIGAASLAAAEEARRAAALAERAAAASVRAAAGPPRRADATISEVSRAPVAEPEVAPSALDRAADDDVAAADRPVEDEGAAVADRLTPAEPSRGTPAEPARATAAEPSRDELLEHFLANAERVSERLGRLQLA